MAESFRQALEDVGRHDLVTAGAGVGDRRPPSESSDPPPQATGSERPIGWRQLFGMEKGIGISVHAAERYRERFGSKFERVDAAREQLRRRLDDGIVTFSRERPRWLVIVGETAEARPPREVGFLIVDEEIVLPLWQGTSRTQPFYAVTCIARQDSYSGGGSRRGMGRRSGGGRRR